MPQYEMPEADLVRYRSSVQPPDELDDFWERTISQARAMTWPVRMTAVETGLRLATTYDVTFPGFGGDPIRAWYHRPIHAPARLPIVVRFQGYGGGRGAAHQAGLWVMAGFACLEVDTRGQGSAGAPGHTPDPVGSAPAHPGFLTRGILDPDEYYYRRVFTDAVLAVDCARSLPGVDSDRVAVAGLSQGGDISLAVAGLVDGVTAVMADVPFLSDLPRAAEIAETAPYTELTNYLKVHRDHESRVFSTLAYFDVSVLARTATAPALFSVALLDDVCPPSTVYAAYNVYGGPKQFRCYRFNGHEGGQTFQDTEQLNWMTGVMPSPLEASRDFLLEKT